MTDRELKNKLKSAYMIEQTDSEKAFIKKYERRNRNLREVLSIEFMHMGPKCVLAGIVLCAIFYIVASVKNANFMWVFSGALTLFSILPMTMIGKSERYGMAELECGCRFSLHFLKSVRMLILGVISLIFLIIACAFMTHTFEIDLIRTVCFIAIPYLADTCGCILITRKWHSKESLYGCIGITLVICLLPILVQTMGLLKRINPMYMVALLVILLAAAVKQSVLYIRESEKMTWNLC